MATLPSHITVLNDAAGFCQVLALATELHCKTSKLHLQSVPSKPSLAWTLFLQIELFLCVAQVMIRCMQVATRTKLQMLPLCSSLFFSLTSLLLHCGYFRKAVPLCCWAFIAFAASLFTEINQIKSLRALAGSRPDIESLTSLTFKAKQNKIICLRHIVFQ